MTIASQISGVAVEIVTEMTSYRFQESRFLRMFTVVELL